MQFQRCALVMWMLLMSSSVGAQDQHEDVLRAASPLTERYQTALRSGAAGNLRQARKDLHLVLREEPAHASAKGGLKLLDDVDAKKIPRATATHLFREVLLGMRGQLQESLSEGDSSIGLSPNYAGAYQLRGRTRVELGDYENALADYSRAIELDASSADAYDNRADVKLHRGDYAGALADCDEAVRRAPSDPDTWTNRGLVLAVGNQPERALQDFNKSIELDPGLPGAYLNMSELFARQGRRREAIQTLKVLLRRARPTYRAEREYAKLRLKQLEGQPETTRSF